MTFSNLTPKKVALITGAASGIGAECVNSLLKLDFKVCATDLKAPTRHDSDSLLCLPMDVRSSDSIEKACAQILERWGQVDALINNAGVFETLAFAETKLVTAEEAFAKALDVNLMGAVRTTSIFSHHMIKRKQGRIINISSISGSKGAPGASAYAASKGALGAFSLSLAAELAPHNIQVNVVQPGFIETPLMANTAKILGASAAWRIPMKRIGQPWEVAELVAFLANCETSYLTGSSLTLDGGFCVG